MEKINKFSLLKNKYHIIDTVFLNSREVKVNHLL